MTKHRKNIHGNGNSKKEKQDSENKETQKEEFICDVCRKSYTEKYNLKKHIRESHHECSYCTYRTKNRNEDIYQHIHENHFQDFNEDRIEEENKHNEFHDEDNATKSMNQKEKK